MSETTLSWTRGVFYTLLALIAVAFNTIACNQITQVKSTVTPAPLVATNTLQPTITEILYPTSTNTPTSNPTAINTPEVSVRDENLSLDFSERFGLGFSEMYTANVDGLEIPIGIGLEYWVTTRPDQQVQEIHIAPDIVDILGDIYLRSCHYRYTKLMGNDVTYEEYLDLVRNGGGQIEIMAFDETKDFDTPFPELVTVDPAEGISFVFSAQTLPINVGDQWNYYIGVDGRGRLNTAVLYSSFFLDDYENAVELDGQEKADNVIVRDNLQGIFHIVGSQENDCTTTLSIPFSCRSVPEDFLPIFDQMRTELRKYGNNLRDPLFNVVR